MKKIKDQVDELQELLFKSNEKDCPYFLRYIEEGYVESVDLMMYLQNSTVEVNIWNSENESREWLEEKQ